MFLSPVYLWLLLFVVSLAALYVVLQFRRTRYVARFSNVELLGSLAPRRPGWRRHLTFALFLAALFVLSLGVARPSAAVRVPREQATVMLDIDVSRSMMATDVLPTRIDAAKAAAEHFAEVLPKTVNLGLVSFARSANVIVPPTLDRASVKTGIESLRLADYTAIGSAIETSLQAIKIANTGLSSKGGKPPAARIVLLSDGSNTVPPSVAEAVAQARAARVSVTTIAFGTADGTVQVPGYGVQRVPADTGTLRSIADKTGGSYHSAVSEQELRSIYTNIGSEIGYRTQQRDISRRFFVVATVLLFLTGGCALLWAGRIV